MISVAGVPVNDGESCELVVLVGNVENAMREVAGDLIEALSTAVV